ncbi:MAG: hypothetical protein OSB65_13595 [Roseibacillus sp.]|jgi:hypothetical protein|nr:hypothetical protein [Roseibacillus sp.]
MSLFRLRGLVYPFLLFLNPAAEAAPLRVGSFEVDASPPVGSLLAYDPMTGVQTPLSCRGIVLVGAGRPIVLCAVDWIGLSNDGHLAFRQGLAKGAETEVSRVAVHTLHQHDAPRCDFSAETLLAANGLQGAGFNVGHARRVIAAAGVAVAEAIESAQPVTHLGMGKGTVKMVASNRRILGEDGKVQHMRFTATRDAEIRAFPAGTIDPVLRLISFWNEDAPLAVLTYYATHPQSYYRTGLANPDFPGLARNGREKETKVPHIHFNGAGGNIGAGKWNDGAKENRQVLANRVNAGMKLAWENTKKVTLSAGEVGWKVEPVLLPVASHMKEETLAAIVEMESEPAEKRYLAAKNLTWFRRCKNKEPIELSCLNLKDARVLHLPGELFVEYQLNAQQARPDLFVALAAYGDYAPGYICTAAAYSEGGYEPSTLASLVDPSVEKILTAAIRKLLDAPAGATP